MMNFGAIYFGNVEIQRVYLGGRIVWEASNNVEMGAVLLVHSDGSVTLIPFDLIQAKYAKSSITKALADPYGMALDFAQAGIISKSSGLYKPISFLIPDLQYARSSLTNTDALFDPLVLDFMARRVDISSKNDAFSHALVLDMMRRAVLILSWNDATAQSLILDGMTARELVMSADFGISKALLVKNAAFCGLVGRESSGDAFPVPVKFAEFKSNFWSDKDASAVALHVRFAEPYPYRLNSIDNVWGEVIPVVFASGDYLVRWSATGEAVPIPVVFSAYEGIKSSLNTGTAWPVPVRFGGFEGLFSYMQRGTAVPIDVVFSPAYKWTAGVKGKAESIYFPVTFTEALSLSATESGAVASPVGINFGGYRGIARHNSEAMPVLFPSWDTFGKSISESSAKAMADRFTLDVVMYRDISQTWSGANLTRVDNTKQTYMGIVNSLSRAFAMLEGNKWRRMVHGSVAFARSGADVGDFAPDLLGGAVKNILAPAKSAAGVFPHDDLQKRHYLAACHYGGTIEVTPPVVDMGDRQYLAACLWRDVTAGVYDHVKMFIPSHLAACLWNEAGVDVYGHVDLGLSAALSKAPATATAVTWSHVNVRAGGFAVAKSGSSAALRLTHLWYEPVQNGSDLYIRGVWSSYQDRDKLFIDLSLWLEPIREGDNLYIRSADTVWTDGDSANIDTEFFLDPVQEGSNLYIRQDIFGGE